MMYENTVIKQWVEALRSGEYKQCFSKLADGECRCAIGVLAEILPECHVKDDYVWVNRGGEDFVYSKSLPQALLDSYGIDGVLTYRVMQANDGYRMSFSSIADVIEGHRTSFKENT